MGIMISMFFIIAFIAVIFILFFLGIIYASLYIEKWFWDGWAYVVARFTQKQEASAEEEPNPQSIPQEQLGDSA